MSLKSSLCISSFEDSLFAVRALKSVASHVGRPNSNVASVRKSQISVSSSTKESCFRVSLMPPPEAGCLKRQFTAFFCCSS